MWIEIFALQILLDLKAGVTPRAGVWIEISSPTPSDKRQSVTPRAGVWIEIVLFVFVVAMTLSHSPCGSVD